MQAVPVVSCELGGLEEMGEALEEIGGLYWEGLSLGKKINTISAVKQATFIIVAVITALPFFVFSLTTFQSWLTLGTAAAGA